MRLPWKKRQTADDFIARGRAAEPADARAGDQEQIGHLEAAGADLAMATHVIHYVYLPDEGASAACTREFEEAGFGVKAFAPDKHIPAWSLHVEHEMVISLDSITETRDKLAGAVTRNGGDYDGWEAAVTS